MNYVMGVLRHEANGHAEERIQTLGIEKNLEIIMIDPFSVTIGINPELVRNHGKILNCDGIISRCEISSCLSPECEAYLRLLQYYESRNIPVINSSQSIVKSQDKFRTHFSLAQNGVPTPKTFITYEFSSGINLLAEGKLQFPFIIKKIYGSRGNGVYKIHSINELERLYEREFAAGEVLFYQEFLDLERNQKGEVRDYRLWVVRDRFSRKAKTMGAVHRNARSGEFRTNASHGGYVSAIESLPKDIAELGERALDAISGDVAGVDVARTIEGRSYVEEVNISFETGTASQELIGDVWAEVIDLLISQMEQRNAKAFEMIVA